MYSKKVKETAAKAMNQFIGTGKCNLNEQQRKCLLDDFCKFIKNNRLAENFKITDVVARYTHSILLDVILLTKLNKSFFVKRHIKRVTEKE